MDEIWLPIQGFEHLYEISNMGRCKRVSIEVNAPHNKTRVLPENILKCVLTKKGYVAVLLTKNKRKYTKLLHRIVASHFIENNENKPQVNHKYGIKTDNRASELEWMTNKENIAHAEAMGLRNTKGENNPCYGLKGKDHPSFGKHPKGEASGMYGKTGKTHPTYGKKSKGENHYNSKLILNVLTGIFYFSVKEAAMAYNIKEGTLYDKLKGRYGVNNTNLQVV